MSMTPLILSSRAGRMPLMMLAIVTVRSVPASLTGWVRGQWQHDWTYCCLKMSWETRIGIRVHFRFRHDGVFGQRRRNSQLFHVLNSFLDIVTCHTPNFVVDGLLTHIPSCCFNVFEMATRDILVEMIIILSKVVIAFIRVFASSSRSASASCWKTSSSAFFSRFARNSRSLSPSGVFGQA